MWVCVCVITRGQVYGMQTQLRKPREQTQQENPALQQHPEKRKKRQATYAHTHRYTHMIRHIHVYVHVQKQE